MLDLSIKEQKQIIGGATYRVYYSNWLGGTYEEFTNLGAANQFADMMRKQGYYVTIETVK